MITKVQKERLEAASRIGKTVRFKDKITGEVYHLGTVEDEIYILVGDYKHMIQRIRFHEGISWDSSKFGYRTGYYTFDKNMKRVIWGRYAQFLTEREYRKLLGKAQSKGWPVF